MIVAAKPHLDLATVHHLAAVVPGHAVAGGQDESLRYQSSATRSPPGLGPGSLECGLDKRRFQNTLPTYYRLDIYCSISQIKPELGAWEN